jgi:cytochrome P450
VVVSAWATNKDPLLWGPDATKFNPNRWLSTENGNGNPFKANPNSGGATSNYAFLTFLHGPRSCIGQGFAKAEFACVLASWVGRFEFSLKNKEEYDEENVVIKGGLTARPANGLWVKMREVDGW